ncbi:MAG: cell filamentation protein Fic [Gammaproteobacteria bacterium]|nr:cell filamentation protein Fic [Gammaproteobacteria bacterium]
MTDKSFVGEEKALFVANKLLAGLVFNMSALEGNPHTFPEVQTLLDGLTVGGHKVSEQDQVHRIHAGWKKIIDDVEAGRFELTKAYAVRINEIVAKGEALEVGGFRTGGVSIAGTEYTPPKWESLDERFNKAVKIDTDQLPVSAYRFFLEAARSQYFWDGNKRTGQLMMNGALMSNGYLPVTIAAKHRLEYNKLMIPYYETGDTKAMEMFLKKNIPWPTE